MTLDFFWNITKWLLLWLQIKPNIMRTASHSIENSFVLYHLFVLMSSLPFVILPFLVYPIYKTSQCIETSSTPSLDWVDQVIFCHLRLSCPFRRRGPGADSGETEITCDCPAAPPAALSTSPAAPPPASQPFPFEQLLASSMVHDLEIDKERRTGVVHLYDKDCC